MKKFICGLIIGVIISSLVGVCAVNSIYENPYKIFVNGEEKQIQGYNIDDYSYFKPVSYTHLDVYKRQIENNPSSVK